MVILFLEKKTTSNLWTITEKIIHNYKLLGQSVFQIMAINEENVIHIPSTPLNLLSFLLILRLQVQKQNQEV